MKYTAIATAALLALTSLHAAASPMSDLTEQHGVSWMIGTWTGGEGKVKVSYEWRVGKHAIAVKFEAGDRTAEGMMALKPGTQEVIYMAVDDTGGVSRGTWVESNGHPALKVTREQDSGETKTIAEHIKVDDSTMKVKVFKQDASGAAGDLMMEFEMKKQ
jgi:hypothetical protein